MSRAVATEASRPKTVSASAGTPRPRSPRPSGPRPRSTPARQRRSSMHELLVIAMSARAREQNEGTTGLGDTGSSRRAHWSRAGVLRRLTRPAGRQLSGVFVKTFPTAKIRNVALVGHGGAGKTSLAEALLLVAGAIPRLGKVEDGSTVLDFDPEEQRRRISVSLALAPFERDGVKVNLLDAPGYADFVVDVAAALQAADLALFVVSGGEGVEVQTEVAWKLAEERGIPRAFFVNKLDRERASFQRTLDQLKDLFGAGVAPLQLPIGEEAALSGVIELLNDTAINYAGDSPTGSEASIPAEMEMEEHEIHDSLVEGIVIGDDDLMERYL